MIRRGLCAALCLGIAITVTVPSAGASDLDDIINTLETPFQAATADQHRIHDYSADFFQESKIASLDRVQQASGTVDVAFDELAGQAGTAVPRVRFLWRYDAPTIQQIVSDGETMWVYLPDNNQVIVSKRDSISQAGQNDPLAFLTGLGNLSRDFSIDWAMPNLDGDGNYRLEMTPRRTSSLIGKLLIVVDRFAVESFRKRSGKEHTAAANGSPSPGRDPDPGGPRFPILSTTVYDPSGNSTVIRFSNLRINQGLPDTAFDFTVPEGVQVVRPTGQETGS